MPDYLQGTINKEIKRVKGSANRVGDHQLMQACTQAKLAADDLAALLRVGYKARAVADYEPEVPIQFEHENDDFSLDAVLSSEAKSWPHKAKALMNSVAAVLRNAP